MIDWYDAAAGTSIADVVRTSLLIRAPSGDRTDRPHLPGADAELLCAVHRRYLEEMLRGRSPLASEVGRWEAVLAAARLTEHAEPDDADLLALWRGRSVSTGPLVQELDALALLGPEDGADGPR